MTALLLRIAAVLACAIAIVPAIGAQQTTRDATVRQLNGPGSIAGRVIAADGTNAPIRRAQVTLVSDDRRVGRTIVSDDDGRFLFTNLPAGRYTIEARKAAYLTAALGGSRPGGSGTPVTLADGQHLTGRVIAMSRGAVVTGTVSLENGRPAVGVTVGVLHSVWRGETEVLGTLPARATTDDMGAYRIYGLPPGEYLVMAASSERTLEGSQSFFQQIGTSDVALARQLARLNPASTPSPAESEFLSSPNRRPPVRFAPVFHPRSTDPAGATRLTLAAGDERTGIDITLRLVPTVMVGGIVTGTDGLPVAQAQVRAIGGAQFAAALDGASPEAGGSTTGSDGRFLIAFLMPGQYTLLATSATRFWAMQDVTIASGEIDVPLRLQPNLTIGGRVVVDSASPNPDLFGVHMRLIPVGRTQTVFNTSAPIAATDRTFRMTLLPGRYRLSISAPPASRWVPVSSTLRGQDTLDAAAEVRADDAISDWVVTITDRPSELAGTITDADGRAATDYYIVVFAADRAFWTRPSRRVVHTRSAGDGSYLIRGLPAGQYRIAALTDLEFTDSMPASFLESLVASSLPVSVTDRQRTTQNLRIGSR